MHDPLHPLTQAVHQALHPASFDIDESRNLDQIDPGGGAVGVVPELMEDGAETGLVESAFDDAEADVLFRLHRQERVVAAGFLLADGADDQRFGP